MALNRQKSSKNPQNQHPTQSPKYSRTLRPFFISLYVVSNKKSVWNEYNYFVCILCIHPLNDQLNLFPSLIFFQSIYLIPFQKTLNVKGARNSLLLHLFTVLIKFNASLFKLYGMRNEEDSQYCFLTVCY